MKSIFTLMVIVLVLIPLVSDAQVDTAWVRFNNGSETNQIVKTKVIAGDTVIVVGNVGNESSPTKVDIFLKKISPTGFVVWSERFDRISTNDIAIEMAIDQNGNIYVCGSTDRVGPYWNERYLLLKYLPNGSLNWYRSDTNSSAWGIPACLDLDSQDNPIMAYNSFVTEVDGGITIIKYSPQGDTLWTQSHNCNRSPFNLYPSMVVDSQDNIYVSATTGEINQSFFSLLVFALTTDGDQKWPPFILNTGNPSSVITSDLITLAPDNQLFVTGHGFIQSIGAIVLRLNSATGDSLWTRFLCAGNGIFPTAQAVDPAGNFYITGWGQDGPTDPKWAWITSFSSQGDSLWENRWLGSATQANGRDIKCYDNRLFVACDQIDSLSESNDILLVLDRVSGTTIGYPADWVFSDTIIYYGSSPTFDLDSQGNIIFASSHFQSNSRNAALIKYLYYPSGDANGNEEVNGIDVVYLVSYFKGSNRVPFPLNRADANGDCTVNGLDVVYLVAYFKGSPRFPKYGDCFHLNLDQID